MSIVDITAEMKTRGRFIIGMVHCLPLPGTMKYGNNVEKIMRKAVADAEIIERAGADAILIENTLDVPTGAEMDMAQVVALASVAARVGEVVSIPFGIDATFNDCVAGISIALATGASFVRCTAFVDTVITAGGVISPCARKAVLYRRSLGAEHVKILADVHVKHSFMLAPHISIEESAALAQRSGADAVIVTGSSAGVETPLDSLRRVRKAVTLPIVVGSGFNVANAEEQFGLADGAIVGSAFKEGGDLWKPVDFELAKRLVDAVKGGAA
jgi:membrane complex biogenesis BtpA family protein